MKKTIKLAGSLVALGALLAGCGGNNALQTAPPIGSQVAVNRISILPPGVAALHRAAPGTHVLMHPNPCCVRTLFVSDYGASQVQLYQYPNATYQGALPQPPETFSAIQGECVDTPNPQNVFIANSGMSTIDEYDHSGTYVRTLSDTGWVPISCSFRQTGPNSGRLAVGNYAATSGTSGSVSVYTETGGVWTGPVVHTLTGPQILVYYVAYKNNTLYLDVEASGTFQFLSMSPGGTFAPIALSGLCPCPIGFPGGVQSVGNYIAVGDQRPPPGSPNIYHILTTGQVTAFTFLSPSPVDLVQFFRLGTFVVGPDAGSANADVYTYPVGVLQTPISAPLVQPVGSAISHQ